MLSARAEAGRPAQGIVFYGLRGVGKTVLLNELLEYARERNWIAAKIEADLRARPCPVPQPGRERTQPGAAPRPGARRHERVLPTRPRDLQVVLAHRVARRVVVHRHRRRPRARPGRHRLDPRRPHRPRDRPRGGGPRPRGRHGAVRRRDAAPLRWRSSARSARPATKQASGASRSSCSARDCPNLPARLGEAKSYSERLFHYIRLDRLDRRGLAGRARPTGRGGAGRVDRRTRRRRSSTRRPDTRTSSSSSARRPGTPPRARRSAPSTPRRGSRPAWSSSTTGSSGPAGSGRRRPNATTWPRWPRTGTGPARPARSRPAGQEADVVGSDARQPHRQGSRLRPRARPDRVHRPRHVRLHRPSGEPVIRGNHVRRRARRPARRSAGRCRRRR